MTNTTVRQLTDTGLALVREIESHLEEYITDKCTDIEKSEGWNEQKYDFHIIAADSVYATPEESNFWHYKEESKE